MGTEVEWFFYCSLSSHCVSTNSHNKCRTSLHTAELEAAAAARVLGANNRFENDRFSRRRAALPGPALQHGPAQHARALPRWQRSHHLLLHAAHGSKSWPGLGSKIPPCDFGYPRYLRVLYLIQQGTQSSTPKTSLEYLLTGQDVKSAGGSAAHPEVLHGEVLHVYQQRGAGEARVPAAKETCG